MTVRELYEYSITHSLLDKQVDDVIAIFSVNNCVNSDGSSKASSIIPKKPCDDILSKVEWSIEDVLWLFSS